MPINLVVIDDEAQYLDLIGEFAQLISTKCHVFSSWSDAVTERLNTDTLLFLDIHMPDDDGIDILMRLDKVDYQGGIVLLSGAEEGVIQSVMKLGKSLNLNILGHLSKPFMLSSFKSLIRQFEHSQQNGEYAKQHPDLDKIALSSLDVCFKNAWLYPTYQPQINPRTNRVVGMECLSRMNHPSYGQLPPNIFIEAIANQGNIGQFTELLMVQAFEECSEILARNPDMTLSFNVSSLSLDQEFTSKVLGLISEKGLDPNQITIEITETRAISLSKDALYAVSKYRAAGVNLSVDDFGTGYSTIMQLNELPFNELKIDRSFVKNITRNAKSLNIVKATVNMAKSLNMWVTAEGVETEKQLKLITDMGCESVQGFIYSKALKVEEFNQFLETRNLTSPEHSTNEV